MALKFYVIEAKGLKLKVRAFWQLISTFFFFYLGFLSQPFTNHRTAGERGKHFFNSSLPLPAAPQTLRHLPSDYCRELTRKSLTTKLRALHAFVEVTGKIFDPTPPRHPYPPSPILNKVKNVSDNKTLKL